MEISCAGPCGRTVRTDSVELRSSWTVHIENEHGYGAFGPYWNDLGVGVGEVIKDTMGGDWIAFCPECQARASVA
jgi:hypothetical protein